MKPFLIVIIVVAALLVLATALAILCYKLAFGSRCDKNALLKYFTAEDFNLKAEPVTVPCGRIKLKGFVYSAEGCERRDKLIIFCHGMGAGHIAYTTEIAYFCKLGYPVLALDSRGCNLSEGKSLKGMYSGVQTVVAAIDFARTDSRLKDYPICLVGHSWGGYSALCASAERKVECVVAVSAPDSPARTLACGAAPYLTKPLAAVLKPFWGLINFILYGAKGNASASACAKKNGARTLLIHGDADSVVGRRNAVFYRADGDNVIKRLAEGKAHNPYNTAAAEKLLAELTAALTGARKMTASEKESFFGGFDFVAATEEDAFVMRLISDFIAR